MAASSGTVYAFVDVTLPDGLGGGRLTGILYSTITVDDSFFQCGIRDQDVFQCLDTQICFHICFHCRTKDAKSKHSKIAHTYSFPLDAGISVISVMHFSNEASEWKSRFSRSSDFMVSWSAFVSPFGFLLSR